MMLKDSKMYYQPTIEAWLMTQPQLANQLPQGKGRSIWVNNKASQMEDQEVQVMAELQKASPPPSDFLKKAAHLRVLQSQAREIVINDLLPTPSQPENA